MTQFLRWLSNHTIRKVKFLSKNSILTKPQHFHEFFHQNFFLTIFLVKSKLSTAKKSKTTTFSRVFHQNFFLTIFLVKSKLWTAKKSKTGALSRVFTQICLTIFLVKLKLNFYTKNKDFEQCAIGAVKNALGSAQLMSCPYKAVA